LKQWHVVGNEALPRQGFPVKVLNVLEGFLEVLARYVSCVGLLHSVVF
jgi:hypothetical protein